MERNLSFLLCAIGLTALGCTMNSEPETLAEEPLDEASSALSTDGFSGTVTENQNAPGVGAAIAMNDLNPTTEAAGNHSVDALVAPVKKAMTWSLLSSASSWPSNVYALVGTDALTDPYQGDTLTSSFLPILCINKNNPPYPGAGVIGSPVQTPGGAWRKTWSGGTVALTAPVQGTKLTSLAVANALCASQLGAGYRMAEHHDGDASLWSGWDFWGAVRNADLSPFQGTRFWVSINDQNTNPW